MIRITIRSMLLVIACSSLMCITAYAGDINGNESSVLGVIYGTFEADGVTYQVSPEYINSAVAYMSQDDVDLTAEQAQEAIAEIYANVSTGVESGYLYPVGGTPETEAEVEPEAPAETRAQSDDDEPETKETIEESEAVETPSDAEAESIAEVIEEIKVTPKAITILEATANSNRADTTDIESGTDIYMKGIAYHTREARLLLIALVVIVVLSGIVGYYSKRYHKRVLRKVIRTIVACTLGILCIISIAGVSAYIGAFNRSIVLSHMSESGYYSAVYDELRTDTEMSLALMGIPLSVMDDAVTYEKVVTAARQQVEDRIGGGDFQADTTLITSKLEENIRTYLADRDIGLTEQAELGLNILITRLNDKYHKLLQWPYSEWWIYLSQRYTAYASYGIPVMLLLLIASQILLIILSHYRHRGVRLCGYSIIAASLISAIGSGICMMLEGNAQRGLDPPYMDMFFHSYIGGMYFVALIISFIGIMVGIGYLLIARYMKEAR